MLSQLLRQFLFTFIHIIVNVLEAVQNVYHRFKDKKCYLFDDQITNYDIQVILEHVPRMKKTPKHVVMLSNTEQQNMSDLALIVIWSLVAGIPYVSFYDITGGLKENEEKFFLEVERYKKGIPGCIKWCNKPDLNGYTHGVQAHTVTINIFTKYDGGPTIAQCIQKIAQKKICVKKNSSDFTAQELDEALSIVYPNIPDPDLVFFSSSVCCTYGLLPWHIRLTEFVQISSHVTVKDYVDSLYKYNKCDQRFGK